MKKLTMTAALFVAVATLTVGSANALTTVQVLEIRKSVLSVPVPEMPAKAAELVKKAEKKDRQAVAVTAVRAIVAKHKAAAPLVIAALSKAAPDLAPEIAVAAAEVAQDQASVIARAAAVSVPSKASEIAFALAKAVPTQANNVNATIARMNLNPNRVAVNTRGSAGQAIATDIILTSPNPINTQTGGAGFGRFPNGQPGTTGDGVVIYSQPAP